MILTQRYPMTTIENVPLQKLPAFLTPSKEKAQRIAGLQFTLRPLYHRPNWCIFIKWERLASYPIAISIKAVNIIAYTIIAVIKTCLSFSLCGEV